MCRCIAEVIVRPPRSIYDDADLPKMVWLSDGTCTKRVPVTFQNSRGQNIVGSFYPAPSPAPETPAVVYLHGNASNQMEGGWLADHLCPQGIGLLTIDTSGCGRSDGSVIGLGVYEREDVKSAIEFLRSVHKVGAVVLWGRSMGAAIALWCAAENVPIQGIIADSGYCSLDAIVEDLVGGRWWLWPLVRVSIPIVNYYVRKLGGYSMKDVCIKGLEKAKCPALFVHALGDDFISIRESREMFAKYGGKQKYFIAAEGSHNSSRPADVRAVELAFVLNMFDIEADQDALESKGDDRASQHFESAKDIMMHRT